MTIVPSSHLASEAASTVELFASFGVAVLAGPYGEKGPRAKDWPRIDAQTAREMTLDELRRHDVNIVLRTGPELAAIDIDGNDGVDPRDALDSLLRILPDGVAVYRSRRGFGILSKPKRVVGDGMLRAYGAELFTNGHPVNIPPSRHPSGVEYEWVIPPGGQLPTVDFEALGLLPETVTPSHTEGRQERSRLTPASPHSQVEFKRLMEQAGIFPRRGHQEMHLCPWHTDGEASLSINWRAAVFNDFGGCGQGGIVELRRLVGDTRACGQQRNAVVANAGDRPRALDPEAERARLVRAMKVSGHVWKFDERTSRSEWEDVLECRVALVKYECANGHRVALPKSCGMPLCPTCMPTRLRADFRRHAESLPARLALFMVAPPEGTIERKEVSSWFRDWRRRSDLSAGFYGVRLCVGRPDILLVIPVDQVPARIVADPHATLVAADVPLEDAVNWYVERFLEEVSSWRTPEEMLDLLAAVKGRRRFQGFGRYYANRAVAKEPEDEQLFTEEPKKLHRVSGGSAKGGSKALACPICGSRLHAVGIALNAEGMEWDSKYKCYFWGIGPPNVSGDARTSATKVTA